MKEWLQVTLFLLGVYLWIVLSGVLTYFTHTNYGDPWGFVVGIGFSLPLISLWWVTFGDDL